jgi:hypothetical protein
VVEGLDGNGAVLPEHILQKVTQRIESAARKRPASGDTQYESLAGQLEFCDLREIQDILTSRTFWHLFEGKFRSKEVLSARFGQLAELRNGIRHSRTVDEVTRKDGEAALLWFARALDLDLSMVPSL